MKDYADGQLCVCCTMLLANGESCDHCDHSEHPLMQLLKDEDVTLNWSSEDEDSPGFQWSSCDGCGVIQGGDYYPVAIWERN